MKYTKGIHYSEYLKVDNDYNKTTTRTTKVIKKPYGYIFHRFNPYIILFYGKLIINTDGTAKMIMKVHPNYRTFYQYTLYFDKEGYEIRVNDNNTRKELSIYNQIRNN